MRLISLLVALAVGGCSLSSSLGLAPSAPPVAYTLRPAQTMNTGPQRAEWQLLVEEPSSASRFDTTRIALSLGSRLDYYADVAWADRLPVLVQRALVESFEKSGRLQSVAADAAGVRGDFSLKIDLREFQANYPTGNTNIPPEVKVRMAAKLVEPQKREVVASENFEASLRAPSARLSDIAAAFDNASQQVLARVVEWTIAQGHRLSPPPPARPAARSRAH